VAVQQRQDRLFHGVLNYHRIIGAIVDAVSRLMAFFQLMQQRFDVILAPRAIHVIAHDLDRPIIFRGKDSEGEVDDSWKAVPLIRSEGDDAVPERSQDRDDFTALIDDMGWGDDRIGIEMRRSLKYLFYLRLDVDDHLFLLGPGFLQGLEALVVC